jgi:precorrin-6x reductase
MGGASALCAGAGDGCFCFDGEQALIPWLLKQEGAIFATTGVKEAAMFTRLPDYRERVWFRLFPSLEGLRTCLELGYPSAHIICMWGPFSQELNHAMFASSGASILVTKDSGRPGGFAEKVGAARELGMRIALLARPETTAGVSLEVAMERLEGISEEDCTQRREDAKEKR